MRNSRLQSGFSTIELLIAFSIAIIFLSGTLLLSFGGQSSTLDTSLTSRGINTALTYISSTTASIAQNWNYIAGTSTDGTSTSQPTTLDISPCVKLISSDTSWTSDKSRSQLISFGTIISNPLIAKALGGDCDSHPPSEHDWDNPENPNWKTSPSDIDGVQSGLGMATIDGKPYVFMTTTNTASSQKDDIWAIDVSSTSNPVFKSSLETGDGSHKSGLVAIDVVTTSAGSYAYVIQNSSTNQLQTISLAHPTAMVSTDITSTISLATYGVVASGTDPIPKVVTYYNGRLYIGLHTTVGPELLVFSVAADPAHPSFVGSINSGFNHSINDIVVNGNYAYLAIAPGSVSTTSEMMVIDVSGSTPVDTGKGFNANRTGSDTEAATALYLLGNKLYMGRERASNASERDFYVLDVSNPLNPTEIKSANLNISPSGGLSPQRVVDLIVHGKIGFFATSDSVKPFQIYDVVSSSTGIVPLSTCQNYINLPKLIQMVFKDDLIYGANGNQAALNILHDQPSVCGS